MAGLMFMQIFLRHQMKDNAVLYAFSFGDLMQNMFIWYTSCVIFCVTMRKETEEEELEEEFKIDAIALIVVYIFSGNKISFNSTSMKKLLCSYFSN